VKRELPLNFLRQALELLALAEQVVPVDVGFMIVEVFGLNKSRMDLLLSHHLLSHTSQRDVLDSHVGHTHVLALSSTLINQDLFKHLVDVLKVQKLKQLVRQSRIELHQLHDESLLRGLATR
jgi:hypothetical protein